MSPRRGHGRRAIVLASAAAALAAACKEVPRGGVPKVTAEPAISRRLLPNEIIPADLDIVVRVDVEKLRQTLGRSFDRELQARFSADEMLAASLARARSLTIGLRGEDLDNGDRVIVVEGDIGALELDRRGFVPQPSRNDKVKIYTRSLTAARDATDAVIVLDERAAAFVSPVETDAVLRILREGADAQRGQPLAEGVVSADVRVKRMPPSLERRYPSLAKLVSQVQRVKALLKVSDEGLRLEGEVVARSEESADKVRRFLDAFREGASGEGATAMLKKMKLEKLGAVVRVTSVLTIEDIAALLVRE